MEKEQKKKKKNEKHYVLWFVCPEVCAHIVRSTFASCTSMRWRRRNVANRLSQENLKNMQIKQEIIELFIVVGM